VAAGIEDFGILLDGNKSLLAEHNVHCEPSGDLEAELMKARTAKNIAALEAKIRSADAHSMDVAAASEKCFRNFEKELIKDLEELCVLFEFNIHSTGGLCSPMSKDEPSIADYVHW
jgi:hypothetical protein